VASRLFRELTDEERALLAELRTWADAARGRPNSKTQALLRWLKTHLLTS
jgi:hypothetical protein